ncbi:hypothetical protein BJX76DRAFT_349295 [Aspergillus varians]
MPPPARPRARSTSQTSTMRTPSAVSAESSRSSAFSETVRLKIKGYCDNKCWSCGGWDPQVCHVIAREDRQSGLWIERCLIDFPIDSFVNGIALCPSCHVQFDNALDPGFCFLPTDLQFFIDFELGDQNRRQQAAAAGGESLRRVPSAEDYRVYQLDQGKIGPDSPWGSYRPIFVKPFLGTWRASCPSLYENKCWHGAPLASLRRSFLVLGSGRYTALGRETWVQLQHLRDLYFCDEKQFQPLGKLAKKESLPLGPQKRPIQGDILEEESRSGLSKRRLVGFEHKHLDPSTTYCPILRHIVPAHWSLGPGLSTNDAIERFSPLFSRPAGTRSC